MSRARTAIIWMVFCILWIWTGTSFAQTEGDAVPYARGKTEVQAGVTVDYMGRVRFEVKDEKTKNPIPGASIELWVPSLNHGAGAYVLCGMTDSEGVLEVDAEGNNIRYQVYKADWLPYPRTGEEEISMKTIPQIIKVWLYQNSGGNPNEPSHTDSTKPVEPVSPVIPQPGSDGEPGTGIPKTGVENYAFFWGAGALALLAAAGIVGAMTLRERKAERRQK